MSAAWQQAALHSLRSFARVVVPDALRELRADRIRSRIVAATSRVYQASGGIVLGGPFRGMRYLDASHSSQLGPKVLGTYEREIEAVIEGIIEGGFDKIVDVGAAEGYYAVGFLRRCGELEVVAFEASPDATRDLLALAELNDVSSRLQVRGFCSAEELSETLGGSGRVCLVMDVDGGEMDLLDPGVVHELTTVSILVEIHGHVHPNIREELTSRFRPTHDVQCFDAVRRGRGNLPQVEGLSTGEVHYAAHEMRPDGQGWLWMRPLAGASAPR